MILLTLILGVSNPSHQGNCGMENKNDHKDFWKNYWAVSKEGKKKLGFTPVYLLLIWWVAMSVGYGGPVTLLMLTYASFAYIRNYRVYRQTGEFPIEWKMTEVFYGKKIGFVLASVGFFLVIALWIYVLILVLTGSFNELLKR